MLVKLKILLACALFGTVYGAVCGGIYGGFLIPFIGAYYGALFGAAGGCVAGVVGGVIGGPLGWSLAGALGGLATGLVMTRSWAVLLSPFFQIPGVIGALVGAAVGAGLRRGESRLPGVERLATTLHRIQNPPSRVVKGNDPGELLPAAAPTGRGNEVRPAEAKLEGTHGVQP